MSKLQLSKEGNLGTCEGTWQRPVLQGLYRDSGFVFGGSASPQRISFFVCVRLVICWAFMVYDLSQNGLLVLGYGFRYCF